MTKTKFIFIKVAKNIVNEAAVYINEHLNLQPVGLKISGL